MDVPKTVEWIQSMRLQLLDSLCELSNVHLQAACWTNTTSSNPHYTLVEFVASSEFADKDLFEYCKTKGVINKDEYKVLLPLVEALAAYSPPDKDWYNPEAVLKDPNWLAVARTAEVALSEFLSLSFNSKEWLEK